MSQAQPLLATAYDLTERSHRSSYQDTPLFLLCQDQKEMHPELGQVVSPHVKGTGLNLI
jgi:hypothetical protein